MNRAERGVRIIKKTSALGIHWSCLYFCKFALYFLKRRHFFPRWNDWQTCSGCKSWKKWGLSQSAALRCVFGEGGDGRAVCEATRSCCLLPKHAWSHAASGIPEPKINPETLCTGNPSWEHHGAIKVPLLKRAEKQMLNKLLTVLFFTLGVSTHPVWFSLTRHQLHQAEETLLCQQKQTDQPALFVSLHLRRFSARWGGSNKFHAYYQQLTW